MFSKGHGSRTIAASELLGTLLAVHLFLPENREPCGDAATMCTGLTDNQGNKYIVQKLMTTKLPVSAVLMQLASMLASRGLWLNLEWAPRELNKEADALTNENFDGFDSSLRIPVCWDSLPVGVMRDVLAEGEGFSKELELRKLELARGRGEQTRVRKRKRKTLKEPWEAN